jgi:hypothetical protein
MACVHFGVAATTKDCDVLCAPERADAFRTLIDKTELAGLRASYRGHLSPPLDSRWMRGGWTAHFTWKTRPEETCLDIFGIAPRGSRPWDEELRGIYASPHVVAEMKRTNRDKDWPFATALGGRMLEAGELEGWLHLYDLTVLRQYAKQRPVPVALARYRPLLRLAPYHDELRVKRLLLAERAFWSELDEIRIRIYHQHLRPYTRAVRRASAGQRRISLAVSHDIRVECALAHLPFHPLRDFGLARLVADARHNVSVTIGPDVLEWLPTAERNFHGLDA